MMRKTWLVSEETAASAERTEKPSHSFDLVRLQHLRRAHLRPRARASASCEAERSAARKGTRSVSGQLPAGPHLPEGTTDTCPSGSIGECRLLMLRRARRILVHLHECKWLAAAGLLLVSTARALGRATARRMRAMRISRGARGASRARSLHRRASAWLRRPYGQVSRSRPSPLACHGNAAWG